MMLEDILLIEQKHRDVAAGILEVVLQHPKEKWVIAISGESGSGKSEIAHVLAKELCAKGLITKPVHVDNFYKVHPLERTAWRKTHGVEKVVGVDEIDWKGVGEVVAAFKTGSRCSMPCVDLVTQRVDILTTDFKDIRNLILDGLYAVKAPEVDLAVMLGLTYHETKKAQQDRGKEKTDHFRWSVLEAEHRAVESLRPLAHLLVDKNHDVTLTEKRINI